jgi:hypothetical protein
MHTSSISGYRCDNIGRRTNYGRVLVELFGSEGARWFNGLGGLAIVMLGVLILGGWTPSFLGIKKQAP